MKVHHVFHVWKNFVKSQGKYVNFWTIQGSECKRVKVCWSIHLKIYKRNNSKHQQSNQTIINIFMCCKDNVHIDNVHIWKKDNVHIWKKTFKVTRSTLFRSNHPEFVLNKRCSENMKQIYRRTPMLKCDFNKVAKEFQNSCSVYIFNHEIVLKWWEV